MKNYGIILFALSAFMLVQCNNKTVKNTDKIKEDIEEKACNHVSIDIFKTDKNKETKVFAPVPDNLHMKTVAKYHKFIFLSIYFDLFFKYQNMPLFSTINYQY